MNWKRLEEDVMGDEGFRSRPYRCSAGKLTIGYGRNLEEVGISRDEALFLLRNDLTGALQDCRRLFSNFEQLTPMRQETLVNMALNLGMLKLSRFYKMIAAVQECDWDRAADEMENSLWARQVGRRAVRLTAVMREG